MGMRWFNRLVSRQVVVHLTDDQSIQGVCVGVYSDSVVLKHARYLAPESGSYLLDGETVVPRDRVAFVQVLATTEVITSDGKTA